MNLESSSTILCRKQLLIDHAVCRVQHQKPVNSLRLTAILEIPLSVPHTPVALPHLPGGQHTSRSQGTVLVPGCG